MSIVICELPKAGLGNQLFPLMNAIVFADLNNLKLIVTGYHRLKIGPYLRREKSKRKYKDYFKFQKTIVGEINDRWRIKKLKEKYIIENEPKLRKLDFSKGDNRMFIFKKMTNYHDYFLHLSEHRSKVIELLYSNLENRITDKINNEVGDYIGVHIRMGDFRKLNAEEIYNSGHVRTPEPYFVQTIQNIRKINGRMIPVKIFTDGFRHELNELLTLENVHLVENNPDIVDLLLLSKSKIIIGTHGSTFSVWAGFLSDACFLTYFDYPKKIRPDNFPAYEGTFDVENHLLINNIKALR